MENCKLNSCKLKKPATCEMRQPFLGIVPGTQVILCQCNPATPCDYRGTVEIWEDE